MMATTNRAIVQRTWGLHAFAASNSEHPNAKRLTYGDEFTYEESFILPFTSRILVTLFGISMMISVIVLLVITPVSLKGLQIFTPVLPKRIVVS